MRLPLLLDKKTAYWLGASRSKGIIEVNIKIYEKINLDSFKCFGYLKTV